MKNQTTTQPKTIVIKIPNNNIIIAVVNKLSINAILTYILKQYKKIFGDKVILGLSDHTQGHDTVLGSVCFGAKVIEKHFTDNNKRNGPDHHFAMNYKTWKEMVERSRELEQSLGNGLKTVEKNELDTHIIQRRSVRTNKDLKKGKRISIKDLEFLKYDF